MTFTEYFLSERTDPDELYKVRRPEVITFAIFPGVGYIYTYNKTVDGEYMQVNHRGLYIQFPGKLVGSRKLLVSNGLLKRNTYFYLEPGQSMQTLLVRINHATHVNFDHSSVLEGRIYKSQIAFWSARAGFVRGNHGMLERLCKDIGVTPEDLSYNFADVGDITYSQVFNSDTISSKEDEKMMELMRQLHLDPKAKSQVLPKINKAAGNADKDGYKSVAQMRNQNIVGDSVGL